MLDRASFEQSIKINVITNFTDQILERLLIGLCLENKIYPDIFVVPYMQYDFFLANQASELYSRSADITFIFFDDLFLAEI